MMNKILFALFVAIITFGLLVTDAEARRFGGGKSFGHTRAFSNQNASSAARPQPAAAKAPSSGNKWLGPLAGLAAGGLLASLFMGHGFGSGILSWLMIAGLAFLAWRLIRRISMSNRPLDNAAFQRAETGRVITNAPFTSTLHDTSSAVVASNASEFDETAFLRQAKTTFIRLQAAYDNRNLNDIREFTAPEVFAEVQMQIQERGTAPNQTDVITVNAELVDLDLHSNPMMASVRFSGLLREEQDKDPENIREIWNFSKDKYSPKWLVTGIQQD